MDTIRIKNGDILLAEFDLIPEAHADNEGIQAGWHLDPAQGLPVALGIMGGTFNRQIIFPLSFSKEQIEQVFSNCLLKAEGQSDPKNPSVRLFMETTAKALGMIADSAEEEIEKPGQPKKTGQKTCFHQSAFNPELMINT